MAEPVQKAKSSASVMIIGLVMVIVALGEFGLVRRLLPELHPAQHPDRHDHAGVRHWHDFYQQPRRDVGS